MSATAANVREIHVRWRGSGLGFEAGPARRPAILVDGDGQEAVSPVELLLVAAATCSATDVVLILQKQRVIVRSMDVAVRGTRRDEEPRRYTDLQFSFLISGTGLDELKARRAIDLSMDKYCSVVASLAPDIRISYDVALV